MSFLTIYIPTYNRPVALRRCLSSLVLQWSIHEDFEIVVSDNCSNYDVHALCLEVIPVECLKRFRYIRRTYNLGGSANVILGVEQGQSDWLWLLGDDDVPHSDCVAQIKAAVGNYPQAIWLNFSSACGNNERPMYYSDANALCSRFHDFSSMLFISTNIYKQVEIGASIRWGINSIHTNCPHFIAAIHAVTDRGGVVFLSESIVTWMAGNEGEVWNTNVSITSDMTKILDVSFLSRKIRFHLGRGIAGHQPLITGLCHYLTWAREGVGRDTIIQGALNYYVNHAGFRFGFFRRCLAFGIFCLLFLTGRGAYLIIKICLGLVGRKWPSVFVPKKLVAS
jgi:glycosyltransferase involved in cell wall biosynthesis